MTSLPKSSKLKHRKMFIKRYTDGIHLVVVDGKYGDNTVYGSDYFLVTAYVADGKYGYPQELVQKQRPAKNTELIFDGKTPYNPHHLRKDFGRG